MDYKEFLKQVKRLEFQELREDRPEYIEFVMATDYMPSLTSILESYYGTAYSPPGKKPPEDAQKYADPYGGIEEGQTLYYLDCGDFFHCALLWPWGNGNSTTIKIFQAEKGEENNGEKQGDTDNEFTIEL
jgi:hypothetical protein